MEVYKYSIYIYFEDLRCNHQLKNSLSMRTRYLITIVDVIHIGLISVLTMGGSVCHCPGVGVISRWIHVSSIGVQKMRGKHVSNVLGGEKPGGVLRVVPGGLGASQPR